jgi:predicted dithiol-disulfide oxidoreductase (DUF899 family)
MTTPLHDVRFPNESDDYRRSRDELLRAEMELRRKVEEVAALRRTLPSGGAPPEDYVFEEGAADLADTTTVQQVQLSELFGGKESLVLYGFMYGPKMERPCPSCTSILDALDATAPHARERVALAVVAKSPIARIRAFARERGWRNLRLLSSAGNGYGRDYRTEDEDGDQWPMLHVFSRRSGEVRHSYGTELLFATGEAGQDPRHVDSIWPLWNLFDLTPEGRGTDWYPKLAYR